MSTPGSDRTRTMLGAFAAGAAVGACAVALVSRLSSRSASAAAAPEAAPATAAASPAAATARPPSPARASPASPVLPASSSPLLRRRESDLALAQEEIAGLLQLLQTRDAALSRVEAERARERKDAKAMQARIAELEAAAAASAASAPAIGAGSSAAAAPECEWPHAYPLAAPATCLPAALRGHVAAVLFDLDGTLVESKEIWYLLLDACSKHLGYGPLDRKVWEPTFGQSMAANRELFFPRSQQQEIDDFCDAHYADFVEHLHVLPGALEALEATKSLVGVERMAICTNCPAAITRIIVESVPELATYFSRARTICSGTTVRVRREASHAAAMPRYQFTEHQSDALSAGKEIEYVLHAKPSTDIIVRACEVMHVDPKRCLFIGDSKYDLMASMAAECFAIGIGEKGRGGNMHIDAITQLPAKLQGAK